MKKKILRDVFEKGDGSIQAIWWCCKSMAYHSVTALAIFRWQGENVATTEVERDYEMAGVEDAVVYGVTVRARRAVRHALSDAESGARPAERSGVCAKTCRRCRVYHIGQKVDVTGVYFKISFRVRLSPMKWR